MEKKTYFVKTAQLAGFLIGRGHYFQRTEKAFDPNISKVMLFRETPELLKDIEKYKEIKQKYTDFMKSL